MMKFRNITTAYLAHKEMAVKATSLNNYRQILRNHLLPEFGERKEISEDDVQRFIVRNWNFGSYTDSSVTGRIPIDWGFTTE